MAGYQPLLDEKINVDFDPHDLEAKAGTRRWSCGNLIGILIRYGPWATHAIFLSFACILFVFAHITKQSALQECAQMCSLHAPALEVISDHYETWRFNGSYDRSTEFRGPPSPSVDAAWAGIMKIGPLSVSEDTMLNIGASLDSVTLPPESGGGYMALLEFVHQLHCVNMLWKFTWPDYYHEFYNYVTSNQEEWHVHADHCADFLRQKLMCDADVNLLTYNWLPGNKQYYPNFNVQHQCRNFEEALEYAIDHQAPSPYPEHAIQAAEINDILVYLRSQNLTDGHDRS